MKLIKSSLLIITLVLSAMAANSKTPTLKSVMQGLGKSMDELNRGLFYEDFKVIEKAAFEVANHPKPKTQLPIIIKTLNVRMPEFKAFDSKVHDAAMEIVELAKKRDMENILKKHKVIMNNCVACHTQFRNEISKALSN